jgi:hypothetical protein
MAINIRRTTSLQIKSKLFAASLQHSLHDGFWAMVPVAIAVAGLALIVWFWQDGPTDLFAYVGVKFPFPAIAKIGSTLLIGFPTVIFVWSSFNNFLLVLNEKGPVYREFDEIMKRIEREDNQNEKKRDQAFSDGMKSEGYTENGRKYRP